MDEESVKCDFQFPANGMITLRGGVPLPFVV